ncbi:hypothetical protein D3C87_1877040 [compost metagenome]
MLGQPVITGQISKSLVRYHNLMIWQLGKFCCKFTVQRLQTLSKLVVTLFVAILMRRVNRLQAFFYILRHNKR